MSEWLWRQIGGWRRLHISGDHLEFVVAQVIAQGFRLWHIQRRGTEFECVVTEGGYECLTHLAGERGFAVQTVRQGGIPFRWLQIRVRPFLLVGLVTAIAMAFYATTHIWVVQVTDPALSTPAKTGVVQAVADAGLRIGVSRWSLDIPAIRQRALQQLPEYSWLGIHVRGVVASVDGVRFVKPPPPHLSDRLVASQSGRVTAVSVYMGEPEVHAGAIVVKGQTLIAGVVSEEPLKNPDNVQSTKTRRVVTPAEGIVLADVIYRVRVFQPLVERTWQVTDEAVVRRYIEFGDGEMVTIWGEASVPFTHYTMQKIVRPMRFARVEWPVRMVELVYNKRVSRMMRLSRRQAVRRARERALQDVRKIVPKGAARVQDQVRVALAPKGVRVDVTWVVNQNIAVPWSAVKPS
jgi:similar to stage IV sporulation protein